MSCCDPACHPSEPTVWTGIELNDPTIVGGSIQGASVSGLPDPSGDSDAATKESSEQVLLNFASVAGLKEHSVAGVPDGTRAYVRGYYESGDRGGGVYVYRTASALTDDTGTILAPDVGSGRWLLQHRGVIRFEQFGVTVDNDPADNQPAAENMVAAAKVEGWTLLAGTGTYTLETHFPIRQELGVNPVLSLEDYNNIVVQGCGRNTVIKTDNGGFAADVFQLNGVKNVTIRDLAISGTPTTDDGTNAISITGAGENILVDNVHANEMPFIEVPIGGPYVSTSGGQAFTIQVADNVQTKNIRFVNCSADGGSRGINFQFSGAGIATIPPKGIVAENIFLKDFYIGVAVEASGVTVPIAAVEGMSGSVSNITILQSAHEINLSGITGFSFSDIVGQSTFGAGSSGQVTFDNKKRGFTCLSCHQCNFSNIRLYKANSNYFYLVGGGAAGENNSPSDRLNFSNCSALGACDTYGVATSVSDTYRRVENSSFSGIVVKGHTGDAIDPLIVRPDQGNTVTNPEKSSLPVQGPTAFVEGVEQIANGTAWTGASGTTPPNGWLTGLPGVFSVVDSGDGAPYDVCLQVAINSTPQNPAAITLSIPTVIGRGYVLSYAFKKGTASAGEVYIGSTAGGFQKYASGNLTDATWTTRRVIFVATTTTSYITILCRSATAGHTTLWDTFSLQQVPLSVVGDAVFTGLISAVANVYANNAAAVAAGLGAGQLYRTGADPDHVCIVH